jgi:cyclopropane-fatty-acyl-phospholipid synthase
MRDRNPDRPPTTDRPHARPAAHRTQANSLGDVETPRAISVEPRIASSRDAIGTDSRSWKAHSRTVLRMLLGEPARRDVAVRYWDGEVEGPRDARLTLVLKHPGALRRMLLPPSELNLAEAYIHADVDAEGDLEEAEALGGALARRLKPGRYVRRILPHLLALPVGYKELAAPTRGRWGMGALARRHSPRRDRKAVRFHYDVGNEFFGLFLDKRMVYSCGYFKTGHESIDEAQEAKLEHTCRKLRLAPGELLLDIGCGWGGMIIHAVQYYGVQALGITLSENQAQFARKRIAGLGLDDRCRVEVRDYRQLGNHEAFDKIVSIGMVEHVGRRRLGDYYAQAYRVLRPSGLFLSHGVVTVDGARRRPLTRRLSDWAWRGRGFIERYVFPDSELLPLGEHVLAAERAGFESRDAESLREHYALTLRHWVRRLAAHRDEAQRLVGDATYRIWRLYMSASAHQFATGRINVEQLLLAKPLKSGESGLPLTRDDLYDA